MRFARKGPHRHVGLGLPALARRLLPVEVSGHAVANAHELRELLDQR
jgi:hypothetical protein